MEFCPKCGSVLFSDENNALKCSCSYFTYLDNDCEYNIKEKYLKSQPIYQLMEMNMKVLIYYIRKMFI